ncbi:MAG: hypothetical protein OQJ89_06325, partial [Kangiellaceae bacterium]|nr:hypothetical protein [Kangiellaceae bacterium]
METLHNIWVVIKNIGKILKQSRFSLIIVLFAVISLEYVGQIKDIVMGLSHPESGLQIAFFILAVNWLAFQSWGWARFIYNRTHMNGDGNRGEPGYQKFLIDWLPRIYAVVTFWAAFRAANRAGVENVAYGIIAVGLLVFIFLIYRRDIGKKTAAVVNKLPHNFIFHFTIVIMAITSVAAIWSPVGFGSLLGAGAVVFLGLGSIIPVGTFLVFLARENGFPVVGFLLLLAVIFSPFNDNHNVRELEGEPNNTADYSLEQSLQTWLAQRDATKPMVLVATAGGGLRASYWTGVVMGRFQDLIPGFNQQVFAVSGVSGGSVGAVFYNGALANDLECGKGGNASPCFEPKLLAAIGQDYLAATATSMLYGDLIQRFLPFPVFSDRAAALEESWEAGFEKIYVDAECGLDKSFTSFFPQGNCAKGWLPRLLINGTYEETGRRLLTTNFKVQPEVFLDTSDFYALNEQKAIRASTAGLNSARFTYVSPAGTFGDKAGHVIDGGYFENYGADTLTNLLEWLSRHPSQPLANGVIVIGISNDSTVPLEQYEISAEPATIKA